MSKTLIIGATSAIAQATARLFAEAGDALFLTARNHDRLEAVAGDLRVRGAVSVNTAVMDVLEYVRHLAVINTAITTMRGLDLVLIAHGTLPDQEACEESFDTMRKEFEVNALSTMSLLTHLAKHFETQGRGTIAVISSVAGERGRRSNYVYGTAKGALSLFLQGLRNRLHGAGVQVLTIKPGFVDTPMTKDFKKGLLWASPEQIGRDIFKAVQRRRMILYTPWYWQGIMWVIRLLPERLFVRLHL